MITIGLTGGIGCGKSTVSKVLRTEGVPIVDADEVAREIVLPGSEGLRAVIAGFGDEYLTQRGELDRARLGAIVFADPTKRARLDAILGPPLVQRCRSKLKALEDAEEKVACFDAPLLIEKGLHEDFRPVVVVACSRATQRERLGARGHTAEEIKARIGSQLPLREKLKFADYVIYTEGSLEETRVRVLTVLDQIRLEAGILPGWV